MNTNPMSALLLPDFFFVSFGIIVKFWTETFGPLSRTPYFISHWTRERTTTPRGSKNRVEFNITSPRKNPSPSALVLVDLTLYEYSRWSGSTAPRTDAMTPRCLIGRKVHCADTVELSWNNLPVIRRRRRRRKGVLLCSSFCSSFAVICCDLRTFYVQTCG